MKRVILTLGILAFILLWVAKAKADWLATTPGNYNITLTGSSLFCGGVDCTGTIHIGSPDSTGFDWAISVTTPTAATFDCSGCTHDATTDYQATTETATSGNFSYELTIYYYFPVPSGTYYNLYCNDLNPSGNGCYGANFFPLYGFDVTLSPIAPIPEPASIVLTLLGYAVLAIMRRRVW